MAWYNQYHNQDFIEDCPREIYENYRANYWHWVTGSGPIDSFSYFAAWLIRLFIKPMGSEEHSQLMQNVEQGHGVDSLLAIGKIKGDVPVLKFFLLFASILSLAIVIIGLFKKISKKSNVPIKQDLKVRTRMFPLWLINVPLVALTLLMIILFSTALWPTYEAHSRHSDTDALKRFDYLEAQILPQAKCEFEGKIVKGKRIIKNLLSILTDNMTQFCDIEQQIRNYEKQVRNDQDSVDETIEAGEELLLQLEELAKKDLLKGQESSELLYANFTIDKTIKILKELKKHLDEVYVTAEQTNNAVLVRRKNNEKKLHEITQPLLNKLDDYEAGLRRVKDSLDKAVTEIISLFRKFGKRMSDVRRDLQSGENPLSKYIFAQAVVAIAGLLAISAIAFGFFSFGVGLAHPPSINYCPKLIKWIRRYLTFVFVLLGVFTVVIFFYSATAAGFAAPATSICSTMYSLEENEGGKDFFSNYTIKLSSFSKVHRFNLSEFVVQKNRNFLEPMNDDDFKDLISEIDKSLRPLETNVMTKFIEKVEKEISFQDDSITLPDKTKFLRPLKTKILALEEVNFTDVAKLAKSPIVRLIHKKIRTFKRMVKELQLVSLNEITISGLSCNPIGVNNQLRSDLIHSYELSFLTFKSRILNSLYQARNLIDPYYGAGTDFCVGYRIPISGIWFAGLLLGIVLMMDMVAIYMISNRLVVEEYVSCVNVAYESFIDPQTTASLIESKSISTISDI